MARLLILVIGLIAASGALAAEPRKGGDAAAPEAAPGARAEVPIRIVYQPNGAVRLTIPVQVGDAPAFEAMLDTGSSGLRLLPGAAPRTAWRDTAQPAAIVYGSGVTLRGTVGEAVVRIGGLASPGPIRLMAVDAIGCAPEHPQCPAQDRGLADFRIGAGRQPGQGFLAIIGVGLRNRPQLAGVSSPLAQLPGDATFLIDLPAFGAPRGRLVINPAPGERAGLALFTLPRLPAEAALPNGLPAWIDTQLPGCVVDLKRGARSCGPTLLDTGAETIDLLTAAAGSPIAVWPAGTPVRVTIGTPPAAAAMDFTVGQPPRRSRDMVRVVPAERGGTVIRAGVRPFFDLAAFYDQRNGVIGLARR